MKGFVSYFGNVERFMHEQAVAAVTAVAIEVTNQCKLVSRGGFKSGRFVTRGWQGIRYQVNVMTATARVGHHEKHWAFWEFGHHNIFTRQYERFQWLTMGFERAEPMLDDVAQRAVRQVAVRYSL